MELNKEQFRVMVMLYAANTDGNVQTDEVKVMLKKSGFEVVDEVEKMFVKMNDMEVLDSIRENKAKYASAEADRLDLISDICAVIEADGTCSLMEEQIVRNVRRVLE